MDVNTEAVSALNSAHQLNNWLFDNSTLECFINDGASDDRAVRCCASDHYYHNGRGRSRSVVVEATANDIKCTYVYKCDSIKFYSFVCCFNVIVTLTPQIKGIPEPIYCVCTTFCKFQGCHRSSISRFHF